MKLLHLKAHNVFSIGTIELDLKDRGLVLITGWSYDDKNGNAAGKSSVANRAICWGMYGRTVDGMKADSVINTSIKNAKHCGVTLTFEGVDGKTYRIYRSRKPNELVLSVCAYDMAWGDEWEDLTQRNDKDTQARIDKLLGRDHKTFIQADFFGQGREGSFLSLPGSEQRAVIEEILPLNSLDEWQENAKVRMGVVDHKINVFEAEMAMARARGNTVTKHLHTLESQSAGWVTNNVMELTTAQHKLNGVMSLSSVIDSEIASLKGSIPVGEAVDVRQSQIATVRKLTTDLATLSYQIDSLTSDIDARAARPDVCRTCDQPLPANKIQENDVSLAADKIKRNDKVKDRGEKEAKLYLANSMVSICDEILELEKQVELKGQQSKFEAQIKLAQDSNNPFTSLVKLAKADLQKEENEAERYRLTMNKEQENFDHYKFWYKAFGTDLKTMLFEKVCPFLEKKTNEFLADLQNAQITVKFSTTKVLGSGETRDKFCVTAASATGSKVFELFSGAEKQLTSFAVGMALSELASMQTDGASSFMILDEPFLYQSPENCERIITFVTHHLVGDKSTILLISNEENLVNLVPNRVHVTKTKGVTSIDG